MKEEAKEQAELVPAPEDAPKEESAGKEGRHFISPDEVEEWIRWRAEGVSVAEIARRSGRAYRMVSERIKAHEAEGGDAEPPDQPEEDEEDGKDGEDGGGDEDEPFARFWLELDGKWYFLAAAEDEADGCAGCAFCLEFGRRKVCAASSSEDLREAGELCKRLSGVWVEGEMEDGGNEG